MAITVVPLQTAGNIFLGHVLFQQLVADGATTATLEVSLARNTIVDKFDLLLTAARAESTLVKNVAQLRLNPTSPQGPAGDRLSVILDFGTLRTVSGVSCPIGMGIFRVTPWVGTGFSRTPVFNGLSQLTVFFDAEIRTERLLVDMTGTQTEAELAAGMQVVLPEAPSGLELRVNGAAPFWTHPAPVMATAATALSADNWNSEAKRLVSAVPALAPLTADPNSREALQVQFVLTSRVPGVLSIAQHETSRRFVRRVTFGSDTSTTLEFATEGQLEVALLTQPSPDVGQTRDVRQVSLTVVADLPAERVLPAVGPEAAQLADISLTPDRAALVRLMPRSGLAELTAVRVPVVAGPDGAEIRVSLWSNRADTVAEPIEALPAGSSQPVSITPGATEQWVTCAFDQPVPLDDANPPWAALLVSRGQVSWALGASKDAQDPLHTSLVRTGPPAGPWQDLPGPLSSGQPGLGSSRGRIRMVGRAAPDKPLAPLLLAVGGGPQSEDFGVTPTARGTTVILTLSQPLDETATMLRITSRTPGSVTLRDIDVVSGN